MTPSDRDTSPWPENKTRPQNRWQIRAGMRRWATVDTTKLRPKPPTGGVQHASWADMHKGYARSYREFDRAGFAVRLYLKMADY